MSGFKVPIVCPTLFCLITVVAIDHTSLTFRLGFEVLSIVLAVVLVTMKFATDLDEVFPFIILMATLTTLVPCILYALAEFMLHVRDPVSFRGQSLRRNRCDRLSLLALGGRRRCRGCLLRISAADDNDLPFSSGLFVHPFG